MGGRAQGSSRWSEAGWPGRIAPLKQVPTLACRLQEGRKGSRSAQRSPLRKIWGLARPLLRLWEISTAC